MNANIDEVAKLLDCASPLALSNVARDTKAPEDWRSPKASLLPQHSRSFAFIRGSVLPFFAVSAGLPGGVCAGGFSICQLVANSGGFDGRRPRAEPPSAPHPASRSSPPRS